MEFKKVPYKDLNSRQKENYNFHKLAAKLADYGFTSLRLSDDWNGADLIAVHVDGVTNLNIQLKGRLSFDKKYQGKNLYIAFSEDDEWYLYPHDELLAIFLSKTNISNTESWNQLGGYSIGGIPKSYTALMNNYKIP